MGARVKPIAPPRMHRPLTHDSHPSDNGRMADEGQPDALVARTLRKAHEAGAADAKPLSERDTLPEIPSQRQPSWKPVPPRLLALSERKD